MKRDLSPKGKSEHSSKENRGERRALWEARGRARGSAARVVIAELGSSAAQGSARERVLDSHSRPERNFERFKVCVVEARKRLEVDLLLLEQIEIAG